MKLGWDIWMSDCKIPHAFPLKCMTRMVGVTPVELAGVAMAHFPPATMEHYLMESLC